MKKLTSTIKNDVADVENVLANISEPTEVEIFEMTDEYNSLVEEIEEDCDLEDTIGFSSNTKLDGFKVILTSISNIPRLTFEEEQALGNIILPVYTALENGEVVDDVQRRKARDARDKLVKANLKLVLYSCKPYMRGNKQQFELEDLFQMGVIGLIRAAEKFDYTKGFKFSTYATWWIKQAITRGIAAEKNAIPIPTYVSENMTKINRVKNEIYVNEGRIASNEEISEITGIPVAKIEDAICRTSSQMAYLDSEIGEDGEASMYEMVQNDNAIDPCEAAIGEDLRSDVWKALSILDEKERLVVCLRLGFVDQTRWTLEDIARLPQFGVTRERIRQIFENSLRKIKRSPKMMRLLEAYAS